MNQTPPSQPDAMARLSRAVLVAAALLALAAVAIALNRDRDASPPAAPAGSGAAASGQQAPDVDAMIAGLEARLKQKPDDAEGWRMLGWAFFETGRYGESASAYARATQIDPSKAEYWSSLGEARVLAGPGNVPAPAREAFARALNIDARDPRARYFTAVAKDLDGDHAGAVRDWLALLADTPAGAPWEQDVIRVVRQVGEKHGIEVESRLAQRKPAAMAGGAAIASSAIPGPDRAQMQAAAQLPPGQQQAMVQQMVDGLEAKLKANPAQPERWIMLMRSRMTLGQPAQAARALRQGVAANPGATAQLEEAAQALGVPGA